MIKKPFTLNKKRFTLMTASAALVVAMAAPVAMADEPGLDTPIDDSREEVVDPADDAPVEEEPGLDTPIEEPPADDAPVEEEPVDTGTEPDPAPVPVVPPADEDPTPAPSDDEDEDAAGPIRVLVSHVDEEGNELVPSVGLRGAIGASYFAENVEIAGYEVTGVDGPFDGTFTESMIQVTFTYMNLATATPVTPTPPVVEAEPGVDTPIDDSGEELSPPSDDTPVDSDDDVVPTPDEPTDEIPVDDSGEEFDEIVVPIRDGGADDTPIDDSAEELTGENDTAIDDTREENKKVDEKVDENGQAIDDTRESLRADDSEAVAAAGSDKSNKGDLKSIPQASAETNWGMIGAGFAAIGAAAMMLFGRREKADATNE